MRAVFLVLTFIYTSTGEPVKEPAMWRFRGVTIDECRALLEGEKVYDMYFENKVTDSLAHLRKLLIHSLRRAEWSLERDAARTDKPIDVVISCDERDAMPDPWETPSVQ